MQILCGLRSGSRTDQYAPATQSTKYTDSFLLVFFFFFLIERTAFFFKVILYNLTQIQII